MVKPKRLYVASRAACDLVLDRVMLDWPLRIDTNGSVTRDELGHSGMRARYEPSEWIVLRRVLKQLAVTGEDVFVDFGSGGGGPF